MASNESARPTSIRRPTEPEKTTKTCRERNPSTTPREDGHGQASLSNEALFPGFLPWSRHGTGGDNPMLPVNYQMLFRSGRPWTDGAHHSISYPQYGSPRSMQATFVT